MARTHTHTYLGWEHLKLGRKMLYWHRSLKNMQLHYGKSFGEGKTTW